MISRIYMYINLPLNWEIRWRNYYKSCSYSHFKRLVDNLKRIFISLISLSFIKLGQRSHRFKADNGRIIFTANEVNLTCTLITNTPEKQSRHVMSLLRAVTSTMVINFDLQTNTHQLKSIRDKFDHDVSRKGERGRPLSCTAQENLSGGQTTMRPHLATTEAHEMLRREVDTSCR